MSIGREWARFLSAVQFLTVLPVPDPGWEQDRMVRAAAWFPAVGLLVGGASAVVWLLVDGALGGLGAGLAVLAGMVLTGGLHEDGLADTADGLGAGRDRARTLEIMADSRIGAHGAAAVVFSIALRWGAVGAMPGGDGALALVIAAVTGRAMMVPATALAPYARETGLGRLTEGAGAREMAVALGTALVVAVLGGGAGLLALVAAVVAGMGLLALLRRRIGGYTGDGLGAICQLGEIAALLVLAGLWGGAR